MARLHLLLVVCTFFLAKIYATEQNGPILFAHRGNSLEFPENTIIAFESARDLGADALELDTCLTLDGHLIVIHNEDVGLTTDGVGAVEDLTLDEIKTLDAGYWFTADGGLTFPFRGQGIRVPTLAEVLEQFPGMLMNIDVKSHSPAAAEEFSRVVKEYNAEDHIIMASFDDATGDYLRELLPNAKTCANTKEAATFTVLYWTGMTAYYVPKSDYLSVPVLTWDLKSFISAVHDVGQSAVFWTINDPVQMFDLLDAGADGIYTDNVREAAKVFDAFRTPASSASD